LFKAIHFKTQVVAGVNYKIKVQAAEEGENVYLHVKVAKPLPHTQQPPFLMEVTSGHSIEDEL
jgi:hypothetical protein